MHALLRKIIASLIIFSFFLSDVAFCMHQSATPSASEELKSAPIRRRAPSSDPDSSQNSAQPQTTLVMKDLISSSSLIGNSTQSQEELDTNSINRDASPPTMGKSFVDSGNGSSSDDEFLGSMEEITKDAIDAQARKPLLNDEDRDLSEVGKQLQQIEKQPFFVKWAYLDHLLEKMAYLSWLRKKDVTGLSTMACCKMDLSEPLWIEGRGIPLKSGYSAARGITGFRQGTEFVLKRSLSLILQGLLAYQLYELKSFQPLRALDVVLNGNNQSLKGALAFIVQKPEYAPYFLSFFAAPVLWGMVKAGLFARRAVNDTPQDFETAAKVVEDFSFSFPKGGFKSFWKNYVRWFLPLHAIDREVNHLVYHLLLDGNLTLDQRKAGLEALIDLTRNTQGWSKTVGLDALQKVASGTSLKQMAFVEKVFGQDHKDALVREKVRALYELREHNPGLREAGVRGFAHNLYAHYLRWTLGDFDNRTSALAWAAFKAGKLAIQINLFVKIAKQIIDYLKCPKPLEQGFTSAMQPAGYSSLYNQKCFEAYLDAFNKVPGQPACTLVNLLPKFKLDPTYTLFNLSGAGVTGEQVADLLTGLRQYQPSIHLTAFDLSRNAINTGSGMRALFEAFKNITMTSRPENSIKTLNLSGNNIGFSDDRATLVLGDGFKYLTNLQTLDLSNNDIGTTGDGGTIAIGEGLKYLTNLQTLDLSQNWIGLTGANGTIAIGEGLKYLPKLQILALSNNDVGYLEEDGTIAIGEGLKYLPNLQTLDLSNSYIGAAGENGTIAIGKSLKYLTNLHNLDLSYNFIGCLEENGTIAIGEGLKYLTNLQILGLRLNRIGSTGANGTIAIGEGLKYLPNLQTLDLSYNDIGSTGANGTIAIGEGLKYLPYLQTLDLSLNQISSGFSHLVSSIIELEKLESLFLQQVYGTPFSQRSLLQQFWNHRNTNTDIYALLTLQDVQNYLNSLSNNTKAINLAKNFPYASADLVTFLFKGLARFHELQTLDLSNNEIGLPGANGTIAVGEGLKYLTNLQTLDLSQNWIGWIGENGAISIGKSLKYLTNLQTLDLSYNEIDWAGDGGIIAIGKSLKYLTNLQTLDLSNGLTGNAGDGGIIAIGKSLKYLTNLQTLDLSNDLTGNAGDGGIIAIGKSLKYLTNLQTLDLSGNRISLAGENGTIAIGGSLKYLTNLQTLDLSYTDIGATGENGTTALEEGLKYLTNLQTLDLSYTEPVAYFL